MENARVENGTLIIEARADGYQHRKYSSARLITRNKTSWTYVKIDVKVKLPTGRGVWPAIWLMPTDWVYGWWPQSGGIDILEYVGFDPDTACFSIHTGKNHGSKAIGSYTELEAPSEQYHIYSLEWDSGQLTILVDGFPYLTYQKTNRHTSSEWPFDQKFHLIMNIAVGGKWGGIFGIDPAIFPQQMVVDYVRMYQKR